MMAVVASKKLYRIGSVRITTMIRRIEHIRVMDRQSRIARGCVELEVGWGV
jgi:hypothetical protein